MNKTTQHLSQLSKKLSNSIPESTLEDEGSGYFIRVALSPETLERDELYGIYYLSDGIDDNSEALNDWYWHYQDSTGRTHGLDTVSSISLEEVVRLGKELEDKA